MRTVPYTAVHVALGSMVLNARRPMSAQALPRGFRPLLPASGPLTRHLLKAVGKAVRPPSTCSALRRPVTQLLWPLLTPAAPSRRLATPVAHPSPGAGRQASQGKTRDLHPTYPPHLRPGPPGDIGLRVLRPPRPEPGRLLCGSCSSGRDFAYSFLRTPPRGNALTVRLTVPVTRVRRGLPPPSR